LTELGESFLCLRIANDNRKNVVRGKSNYKLKTRLGENEELIRFAVVLETVDCWAVDCWEKGSGLFGKRQWIAGKLYGRLCVLILRESFGNHIFERH
jgi:hypothetical protein